MKTKEPMHWFGRRQHLDVALLLRRRLEVLDGDTLVRLEQWQCLVCFRSRDRLSDVVSRSQGDQTI